MGKVEERGEVARWERWETGVRWKDGGERSGGRVGKMGKRGEVARCRRWGRRNMRVCE